MMQSGVPGQDRSGRVVMAKSASRGDATTVNSDLFRKRNEADIPVDQVSCVPVAQTFQCQAGVSDGDQELPC